MYYKLAYAVYFLFPQDIDRNQKIFALNGKQFFLLDVIAHILHHLKNRLLMELRDHGTDLNASDFDWVITVPAFWKSRAKALMLEAGYTVSPNSNCKFPTCSYSCMVVEFMSMQGFI